MSPTSDASTELASRRTGMAFQRTRLAAGQTVMEVIRTSLSLLSFGFTIQEVFDGPQERKSHCARRDRAQLWHLAADHRHAQPC